MSTGHGAGGGWLLRPSLAMMPRRVSLLIPSHHRRSMNKRQAPTDCSAPSNVRFVEGFRALAYEILTWRNPRVPCTGLWVNGLWDGSVWQAMPSWECCQGSDYHHVEHRQIAIGVCFVGPFARCQDRVWDWRALPHRPSRSDSDRFAGQAMPGHDASSRISSADGGGARGCRRRSKVSMMIM